MRLFFIFLLMFSLPAMAGQMGNVTPEETKITYPTLTPEPQILKKTGTARVIDIIDGLRLQLDSKKIIQLSSLDIPDMLQAEPGDIALAAMRVLEKEFKGQKINIYQSINAKAGRTNRMGDEVAHITRFEDDVWAQAVLLQEGLARVRTTLDNRVLAKEMYEIEKNIRGDSITTLSPAQKEAQPSPSQEENSLNLWQNEKYQILTPDTALEAREGYTIVEGTILKTASLKNNLYLNFGTRWQNDFTIGIDPAARRLFSREGLNPVDWAGKKVRVRGWLEEYNGPYISLDHPERIEFIDEEIDKTPTEEIPGNALPDLEKFRPENQNSSPAGRS